MTTLEVLEREAPRDRPGDARDVGVRELDGEDPDRRPWADDPS